jgi:hypothetical protein
VKELADAGDGACSATNAVPPRLNSAVFRIILGGSRSTATAFNNSFTISETLPENIFIDLELKIRAIMPVKKRKSDI